MKTYKIYMFLFLIIFTTNSGTNAQIYVCSDPNECPYDTINEAINAAADGDRIVVKWESAQYSTYDEHLTINKQIVLTSDGTGQQRPIIRQDLTSRTDIILVDNSSGTFVQTIKIENLILENTVPIPAASGDSTNMTQQAGIRISELTNSDCIIRNCQITRCRVGILIDNTGDANRWTWVDRCDIGKRYENPWFYDSPGTHPGNFFGIVQMEPPRYVLGTEAGEYHGDLITDCTILRNRFYGVVLRGGSQATVRNNLIIWNGTDTQVDGSDHYGDGGILCLYTGEERAATDVRIQAPWIMSNDLYGNRGFQLSVLTRGSLSNQFQIVNNPIVMSNIIGPDPWSDPGSPEMDRPTLVSCISESPVGESTPEYGSGITMAHNSVYRWTQGNESKRYFAHPSKPTATPQPTGPTATPSSPITPTAPPSPTATATVIHTRTPGSSPTWCSPTPTITGVRLTPTPEAYDLDNHTWTILTVHEDPQFVGGTNAVDFDFHLKDPVFQITPTPSPMDERSSCFDKGGFNLSPGSTRSNGEADVGWSDAGRHFPPNVPAVSNLTCGIAASEFYAYLVTWSNPDHNPDGSVFDNLAGHIIYYLKVSGTTTILAQHYIEPSESFAFKLSELPPKSNYVGVANYNTMGSISSMEKAVIP